MPLVDAHKGDNPASLPWWATSARCGLSLPFPMRPALTSTDYALPRHNISGGRNVISRRRNVISRRRNVISGGRNVISRRRNVISRRRNVISRRRNVISGCRNVISGGRNVISGGRNVISGGRNVISGGRNVISGGRNVSAGGRNVSAGGRNVSAGGRNVSAGGRNVSAGGRNVSAGAYVGAKQRLRRCMVPPDVLAALLCLYGDVDTPYAGALVHSCRVVATSLGSKPMEPALPCPTRATPQAKCGRCCGSTRSWPVRRMMQCAMLKRRNLMC